MPGNDVSFVEEKRPSYSVHRTVRLTEGGDAALRKRADYEGKEMGEIIREALDHYFRNVPARRARKSAD